MRKNVITGISLVALSAGTAQAGGFELQTLDTSMMYADGNQASITYATIDASVEGVNTAVPGTSSKKQVVADQTVVNFAAKYDFNDSVSFGLATYRSGSIQLSGGNGQDLNLTPTADVDLNSMALLSRYNLNDNLSFIGGITQNNVRGGNVSTLGGSYDVASTSELGYVAGLAYSIPDIALRAELTYQPKTKLSTTTGFTPSALTVGASMAAIAATPGHPLQGADAQTVSAAISDTAATTNLALPDTFAFNFQTGIADNTLLTASYRKASWGDAQINIDAAAAIATEFDDSESYSIGVARRFTEHFSASLTYSQEEGSSAPATSLFTVSNGSEAISLGLRYTRDNMIISGGISQRSVGDVTVDPGFAAPNPYANMGMRYTGNSVTSVGVKVAFTF